MFDTAIIGAGPAGLSAAMNLKIHNKDFVWFGSRQLSEKVEKSHLIANYPGLEAIGGTELNRRFLEQIDNQGLSLTEAMVTNILPRGDGFLLLADNALYEAKTILFAIGTVSAKGFAGEKELLGRGVSYCATCDGAFFRGKTIAVYCGAKRYEHEAEFLADIAGKVYLSASYPDCGLQRANVERLSSPVKAVLGEKKVTGIRLTDGTEREVDGVFILRSAVAPATLLPGLEMDGPHIRVDRSCRTNKPGVFAAGDCTGRPYQIAKAVGEGNVAAHALLAYLAEQEKA